MKRYSWILILVGLLAAGCAEPATDTTGDSGEQTPAPEVVEQLEEEVEEVVEEAEEVEQEAQEAATEVGKAFDEAVQSPDIEDAPETADPVETTRPEAGTDAAPPEEQPASDPSTPEASPSESGAAESNPSGSSAETNPSEPSAAEPAASSAAAGSVALTPANTRIQFVGTHTGDDPKPRTGTFGKFQGTADMDGGTLKSLQVEIDTASLATDIEKLTNHLKSPDFFDVRQFPKATFQSTAVERAEDGTVTVKGNLTLLGETRPVSFPAKVSAAEGLSLSSEFTVDRTQFGMNYGLDNVEKLVTLTVTVGG